MFARIIFFSLTKTNESTIHIHCVFLFAFMFLFSMNEIAGNDEWFFFRILIACVD